jgi:hypothetical protein
LLYFRQHLRSDVTGGQISFSDFHLDLCRHALTWTRHDIGLKEIRHAWIAPRESGKSTWLYLILPTWALAHRHRKYAIAFADSGPQAQQHLISFRRELETNARLRTDFRGLCTPETKTTTGRATADSHTFYLADNGTAFQAKGIDSSTLGAKSGELRPDLIIGDDLEPPASNYSEYQKGLRLSTLVDAVFPMNFNAVVQVVGTTVMTGSIIDDIAKSAREGAQEQWPAEENIQPHHYPALITNDDGTLRSLWPQRWPLDHLLSIAYTRSFALNMQNSPLGAAGGYWSMDDFNYGRPDGVTFELISVDPSKTTKRTSDFCGISVIGYCPPTRDRPQPMAVVEQAYGVKLVGEQLRMHLLGLLAGRPRVRVLLVEVNDGGEHWHSILHNMPVRIVTVTQSESKEARAANVLHLYQTGQVWHPERLHALEEQMVSFPRAPNDDLVDATGSGVWRLLRPRGRAGGETLYQQ